MFFKLCVNGHDRSNVDQIQIISLPNKGTSTKIVFQNSQKPTMTKTQGSSFSCTTAVALPSCVLRRTRSPLTSASFTSCCPTSSAGRRLSCPPVLGLEAPSRTSVASGGGLSRAARDFSSARPRHGQPRARPPALLGLERRGDAGAGGLARARRAPACAPLRARLRSPELSLELFSSPPGPS